MATARMAAGDRSAEHRFHLWMSLLFLGVVVAGFGRTFFFRAWFPELVALRPPEPFFTFHGALFTAWFVLLVLQAALVSTRRIDLHRKVGWVGGALAVALVVVGVEGALLAARRPGGFMGVPFPAAQFLIVPLADMFLFALLAALGILYRRDPQAHKRFLLFASANLLPAATARLPLPFLPPGPPTFFGLLDLLLLPIVLRDLWTRRRLHPATAIGFGLTVASQPLRLWLSGTDLWLRLAERLIG